MQYRLFDENGNEVEEVFAPTGDTDERDTWLAGYARLEEKYDEEEIEELKPGEPLWALHPEGSPVSKVFSYCRNCGWQFFLILGGSTAKHCDNPRVLHIRINKPRLT